MKLNWMSLSTKRGKDQSIIKKKKQTKKNPTYVTLQPYQQPRSLSHSLSESMNNKNNTIFKSSFELYFLVWFLK